MYTLNFQRIQTKGKDERELETFINGIKGTPLNTHIQLYIFYVIG